MEDMEMTNVEPETEVVDSDITPSSNGTNYGLLIVVGVAAGAAVFAGLKAGYKYVVKPTFNKVGEWWNNRTTKKNKKIVTPVQKDDVINTDPATMVIEDPVVEEPKK